MFEIIGSLSVLAIIVRKVVAYEMHEYKMKKFDEEHDIEVYRYY